MEFFDVVFYVLGLVLGTWVLISPGWRLYGLRSQRSALKEQLLAPPAGGSRADINLNLWLPSWFALSVADPMYWLWFFSYASTATDSAPAETTLVWSELSEYMGVMILLTIVVNTGLLLWVCILDHRKALLLCLAAEILGLLVVGALALLWKGQSRLYILGSFAVVLTSERPQFTRLALSVAIAGAIAGILWIPSEFVAVVHHRVTEDASRSDVWAALFKNNFFWKVSSATGSIFRGRDVVFLVRLAGGLRAVGHGCDRVEICIC